MAYTKDPVSSRSTSARLTETLPAGPQHGELPHLPNIDIPSTIEINGHPSLGSSCCQAGMTWSTSALTNSFTVHVQGQTDSVTVSFSKDELESSTAPSPHAASTADLPRAAFESLRFPRHRQVGLW